MILLLLLLRLPLSGRFPREPGSVCPPRVLNVTCFGKEPLEISAMALFTGSDHSLRFILVFAVFEVQLYNIR